MTSLQRAKPQRPTSSSPSLRSLRVPRAPPSRRRRQSSGSSAMSPKKRIALSAALAVLALIAITAVAALRGKPQRERRAAPKEILSPAVALKADVPLASALQSEAGLKTPATQEQPIEEVLLEGGEDPRAVFYMS